MAFKIAAKKKDPKGAGKVTGGKKRAKAGKAKAKAPAAGVPGPGGRVTARVRREREQEYVDSARGAPDSEYAESASYEGSSGRIIG